MPIMGTEELSAEVGGYSIRLAKALAPARWSALWAIAVLVLVASPMWAQADPTFDPSFSVGGGIQTSYHYTDPTGAPGTNDFTLDHARLYFSGDVTKNISVMFNTDYTSGNDNMNILDAVGQFHFSPKVNIWVGRFLPPSDRDNLTGPFYANEWAVYNDGIQDGYPFVYQGRDNGAMYWGDFKAGIAKIKVAVGAFDGPSADGNTSLIWGTRMQIDFWDAEDGYYQNSTYYGDKNLLAIAGANEVQGGKTATTVDFLMEKKVPKGGAFTIESEYSRYVGLGAAEIGRVGYNSNFGKSEGAYGLASFLIPKEVGIGKFEVLGKYAIAEFSDRVASSGAGSYRQNTAEVNFDYIIKQFDARVMSFYKDTRFNAVEKNTWEAGVGLQLQISKQILGKH